jgi:methionyl-tRNA formyltransferase
VRWRVAIITAIPPVAIGYTQIVRDMGHEPVVIVTPRGNRGRVTPLGQAHVENDPRDVDILFAASKHSLARILRGYDADLAVCTGFPWLIPQEAIDAVPQGIVNGHPSLLPRYRGPFPIAWAVRNGERELGFTYHLMDAAFDTGNILAQGTVPLDDEETEATLIPKLEAASRELLPRALERLANGDRGDPQGDGGDYQPAEALADYVLVDLTRTAAEVHRQARTWSFVPPVVAERGPVLDGRRLVRTSLTEVAGAERLDCADGPLWVLESEPLQATQ